MQAMRYDDAVASLFQSPLDQFVIERKRLAGELKADGDKDGAARLAKLARPPLSAWTVDQLWWRARPAFDALFETARRLRDGELDAMTQHRDAVAKLRAEAAKILNEAEHAATEPTLRRVTQTLSALAAAGGWDPDPPGALSADRDPPGFEAVGISNVIPFPTSPRPGPASTHDGSQPHPIEAARARRAEAEATRRADTTRRAELESAAARAEAAAEQRRAEAERARRTSERHRIEAALRTARGDVTQRVREVGRLERDLEHARSQVEHARAVVAGLEERLSNLDSD
jgi:hypothetical protein